MNTNEYTFASNLKDKSYQYLQQLQSITILKAIDLIEHFVDKLYYYYSKNKYLSFRCSTISVSYTHLTLPTIYSV